MAQQVMYAQVEMQAPSIVRRWYATLTDTQLAGAQRELHGIDANATVVRVNNESDRLEVTWSSTSLLISQITNIFSRFDSTARLAPNI